MTGTSVYAFEDFEFDPSRLELRRDSQPVRLNQLSMRLLSLLVQSAGRVVTKEELLERVWEGRAVSDNVITVAITRLRKALELQGGRGLIANVHGLGYRFAPAVSLSERLQAARETTEPFVGRAQLLSHLSSALMDVRTGAGSVVLLMGEAGIGKTRATEEFARAAAAQTATVAWGRCREFGDTPPLWPFSELLRDLLTQQQLDPTDPRLADALLHLQPLLPELVNAPGQRVAQEQSRKHQIFDGVARTLACVAQDTPCVLVLDDLHRADPASLELLIYLLDDLPRTRLLIVGALRSQRDSDNALLARVLGHRNVTRVALPRLSESDVGTYLHAALRDAPERIRQAVFDRSEGNPFFMTEMARQLRLSAAMDGAVMPPDAALDLLRQRISALTGAQRDDLAAAAVIGRAFSLAALQSVTERNLTCLIASLDAALAFEIVVAKAGTRTEFSFSHELLRCVLYEQLEPARRRSLHLSVVHALEQRKPFEPVAASDLAYHARAALPLGDLRKTVSYCTSASEAAVNVFAFADGARYLQYARETLELLPNPSPRLRLRLALQQALLTRAHCTRAFIPLIAQVLQLARELGEADTMARAAMLHDPYPGLPALPGAVQAFQSALAVLQSAPAPAPLTAAMIARLAASPPCAFDAARCATQLELAEQHAAQSQELLDEYSVRVARLFLTGGPAHPDTTPLIAALEALYRANPQVLSVPPVMLELHCAVRALQDGALPVMHAALERATARCQDLDSELLWYFKRCAVIARLNAGQGPSAHAALRALHARARSSTITGSELFCAYDEVIVLGTAGPAEALRETFAVSADDRPNIWSLKLRALQAAGLHAEARAALQALPASQVVALPCDRDYLGTLGALTHAALGLGEFEYAAALYPLLLPFARNFSAHLSFLCEGSVSGLLGMLARALGRKIEARAHLQAAVEYSARVQLGPCIEMAKRELARAP
jgi:DNA-binding winged helix-turn-helix (wHTH) protein